MMVNIQKYANDYGLPDYFDMQAELGHTKHLGGWFATEELLERCQIKSGQELLYIGSGAGISPVKIAQEYECRIIGVDLLESMVAAASRWAIEKNVADMVEFRVADAQDLPFEQDRFDIVVCESVNTFVPDLDKAASEYVRVTKPGGYVGMNEAVWITSPTKTAMEVMDTALGHRLRRSEDWVSMLEGTGLDEVSGQIWNVHLKTESRSQKAFLSWGDYARVLGRFIKSFLFSPGTRNLIKVAFSEPKSIYNSMGYGLYVGRKPQDMLSDG